MGEEKYSSCPAREYRRVITQENGAKQKKIDCHTPCKVYGSIFYKNLRFSPSSIRNDADIYSCELQFDVKLYEQWINGAFTKCVLEAKNKNKLLTAKKIAEEIGLVEGEDFFLIRDNCLTELTPEEDGTTLTVIGFKPMDSEIIDKVGNKFQLYK